MTPRDPRSETTQRCQSCGRPGQPPHMSTITRRQCLPRHCSMTQKTRRQRNQQHAFTHENVRSELFRTKNYRAFSFLLSGSPRSALPCFDHPSSLRSSATLRTPNSYVFRHWRCSTHLAIALAHFYHAKTSFFLDELSLPIRSIERHYSLPQFDFPCFE